MKASGFIPLCAAALIAFSVVGPDYVRPPQAEAGTVTKTILVLAVVAALDAIIHFKKQQHETSQGILPREAQADTDSCNRSMQALGEGAPCSQQGKPASDAVRGLLPVLEGALKVGEIPLGDLATEPGSWGCKEIQKHLFAHYAGEDKAEIVGTLRDWAETILKASKAARGGPEKPDKETALARVISVCFTGPYEDPVSQLH